MFSFFKKIAQQPQPLSFEVPAEYGFRLTGKPFENACCWWSFYHDELKHSYAEDGNFHFHAAVVRAGDYFKQVREAKPIAESLGLSVAEYFEARRAADIVIREKRAAEQKSRFDAAVAKIVAELEANQ